MTLGEQKAICDSATPGPWVGDRYDGTVKYFLYGAGGGENAPVVFQTQHKSGEYGFISDNGDQDEVFIKTARTEWPKLIEEHRKVLDEIERLRNENRSLKIQLDAANLSWA